MWGTLTTWIHYLVEHPSTATLVIGGGLFALAFLILQLTRWGQENPVSKCVALSVFAHIILLVYAYTTNLITHVPLRNVPTPVPIQLADVPPEPRLGTSGEANSEKPFWEQFPDNAHQELLQTSGPEPLPTESVDTQSIPDPEPPSLGDSVALNQPPARPQELAPGDLVQNALENSLQPRNTGVETLPAAQPQLPSEQEIASTDSEVPGRTAAQADEPDPNHWLAEQVSKEGPRRVESEQQFPSLPTTSVEKQEAILDQQRQKSWDAVPSLTDPDRMETLVRGARQSPTRQDPWDLAQQKEVDSPTTLPRTPAQSDDFPAGRRRLGDGQPLPVRYARRQQHSVEWLETQGGSQETELAIARALTYLASIQQTDGSWNPRMTDAGRELQVLGHNRQGAGAQADTGITGLAILAFLGAGNTHLEGPYRDTVRRGLEYLMARQQKSGSLAGPAQFFAQMYCHSMGLLALSEAYSLTGDPRLSDAVKRGVAFSVESQNPTVGGWRYQPGDSGDMSQFGWQVMALNSAALNGQNLEGGSVQLMKTFLQKHTQGTFGGLAHYRYGEDVSPVMTAEAMFCRYLLDEPVSPQAATEACREILGSVQPNGVARQLPGHGVDNVYFWYYGTLALHQMAVDPQLKDQPVVQQAWSDWNQKLKSRLLALQETEDGLEPGSWDSKWFMWGCYGGRVYSTAMSAMCLQVYYRYDLEAEQRLRTAGLPVGPAITPSTPVLQQIGDQSTSGFRR